MLIVDSVGHPVRYSDVRGDLRGPNDSSSSTATAQGPRTSIALNLLDQSGVLRNTGSGLRRPRSEYEVRLSSTQRTSGRPPG